jgi:hypothetical protein
MSLKTPMLFSEVADNVTCNGYGDCVSLLREPDAANPHVRFDERGVENGSMVQLVRHRQTKESETDRLNLNHRVTPRLHKKQEVPVWVLLAGTS